MAIAIFYGKNLNLKYIVKCFYRLFRCNRPCYSIGMVSVTSEPRYVTSASRYQSRSAMYIRVLIPRNSTELAEAFPIEFFRQNKW